VREYARVAARRAEVAVAHLDRGGAPRIRVERQNGEELPTMRVRYPRGPGSIAWHLAAARAAWRALPFEPDLIFAHFVVAGVPAVILGRLHGKPVAISENWGIFLPDNPDPVTLPLRLAARFAFGRADVVLPASEAMARALRDLGIKTPMRVVPNVVDDRLFRPAERPPRHAVPRLLTVGLFYDGAKGIDLLIEALARLDREVTLDIVGDGAERGEYEELVRRHGLTGVVTFRGLLPKPAISELMREADAFVLASRFDHNPVVLLEALMSGLPAMATAVGGVPEVVHERNGVLARPNDVASIRSALGELLDRLPSYDSGSIAREARDRFSANRVDAELSQAFEDVLARRDGR
jgi:glycosyltransferase involved in cell wall biosynthesis